MAISPLYIPLFTIEEVILDKDTGLPLAGGVVKFYRDSQRLTPKPVYKISGVTPNYTFVSVGVELTLGIAGDFVDQDGFPFVPYAYPYDADGAVDLYYVTVTSAGGVHQFVREAVPYIGVGVIPPTQRSNTENELSNPQFVEVLFSTGGGAPVVINVTGANTVTPIAPDWDVITSGTGTITVERLQPTTSNVPTNPPYTLSIAASAGLGSTITIRQRLTNTPSILRGGFASGSLIAAVLSGGGSTISMTYAPSTGTPTTVIPNTSIPTDGLYHTIAANAPITVQANSPADTGYVDINIVIPTARTIALSSIQLVGVSDSINIPFDEQTAARQKDHLFHYYEDSILHQPKENLLTAWTFALNPWQFRTTSSTNVANNTYTADQTIIIQQAYVDSATGNNVAVSRGTLSENYPFKVTAVTATNKFAMVQYIDAATIRPYWNSKVSARVNLTLASPTHSSVCRFKVRLIYRASVPPTIAQDEPITSWTNAAGSDPVFKSGWTAIAPLNDPIYTISTTANVNYDFDQFLLPPSDNAAVNGAMTLGIVIYTLDNMDQTATADQILFNRVSFVHNDFAIDASVETWDETLRKCQYYYEKSYAVGVLPGTSTTVGLQYASNPLGGDYSSTTMYKNTFELRYSQIKRAAPTVTFYAPDGTANNLALGVYTGAAYPAPGAGTNPTNVATSGWTQTGGGNNSVLMRPNNATAVMSFAAVPGADQGEILYHYVADSRLGI